MERLMIWRGTDDWRAEATHVRIDVRYVGIGTDFVSELEYDEHGLVLNYPQMAELVKP
jgi:hypothetical protein